MIYLADIRNWLKQFNIADYYYSGTLLNSTTYSLSAMAMP